MKIITQKPMLVITAEEKATLEKARAILDKFTDENEEFVDEILDEWGYCFDNVCDAYNVIGTILEEATTANSEDAKTLAVYCTAQLVVG